MRIIEAGGGTETGSKGKNMPFGSTIYTSLSLAKGFQNGTQELLIKFILFKYG